MDETLTADLPLWADEKAYALLCELSAEHQIPVDAFRELVAIERRHQHRERARGIYEELDDVFYRMP
jgi:hypothetical protein